MDVISHWLPIYKKLPNAVSSDFQSSRKEVFISLFYTLIQPYFWTFKVCLVVTDTVTHTPQDHSNFLPAGYPRRLKTHQPWPLYKPPKLSAEAVRSDSSAMPGPQLHLTVPRNTTTWACGLLLDVKNFLITVQKLTPTSQSECISCSQ